MSRVATTAATGAQAVQVPEAEDDTRPSREQFPASGQSREAGRSWEAGQGWEAERLSRFPRLAGGCLFVALGSSLLPVAPPTVLAVGGVLVAGAGASVAIERATRVKMSLVTRR